MNKQLHIYADGSCLGNPGPMGIGIVVYEDGTKIAEEKRHLGQGTNNVAELEAVILAMKVGGSNGTNPVIYTDSNYCVGLLELGHKAKKNQVLVGEARAIKNQTGAIVVKISGHAGIAGNELADKLAKFAAGNP